MHSRDEVRQPGWAAWGGSGRGQRSQRLAQLSPIPIPLLVMLCLVGQPESPGGSGLRRVLRRHGKLNGGL